jgi:hypothetical protein
MVKTGMDEIFQIEKPFKLTLRVVWWMQIFQMLFALPCTAASFFNLMSTFNGAGGSIIASLFFAFLAYMGWANALSTIQITDKSVTVTVFYGRFRIKWSEVEEIVLNSPLIALIGNDKRVVLSLAFAGRSGQKMLEYFGKQIQARKILFEENTYPFPITHQNARVWR